MNRYKAIYIDGLTEVEKESYFEKFGRSVGDGIDWDLEGIHPSQKAKLAVFFNVFITDEKFLVVNLGY